MEQLKPDGILTKPSRLAEIRAALELVRDGPRRPAKF
jgi:hypothetical protein